MPIELAPDKLCHICSQNHFNFETTADLPGSAKIIGQPRGTRAIEFGIGIKSQGYNTYVLGATGTGRATAIERFLQDRTRQEPAPSDWIYVHNFTVPHQPRAIAFAAGRGAAFKDKMAALIDQLQIDLPQAFDTDAYQEEIQGVRQGFEQKQTELLQNFQQKAAEQGFALLNTASGFTLTPMMDGSPMTPEAWQQLPVEKRRELDDTRQTLGGELENILHQLRETEANTQQTIKQIDNEVAQKAIQHLFVQLKSEYTANEDVQIYLEAVRQDVLSQIDAFAPPVDKEADIQMDLSRYQVNLLVNNGQTSGAPVIIEQNPTYHNLFGRIEYEMHGGFVSTHFTNIKCGSLHWANGGYLIMNANELMKNPAAWEALKRALKTKEIFVQPSANMDSGQVVAKSLDPEAIPLKVKIILLGSPSMYYLLFSRDEDFGDLFKVRADFDTFMPRDDAHEAEYAQFVATLCHEEGLNHFDRAAVEKMVEFGSRLADHQDKLSTRFGMVADLIREASYWTEVNGRTTVTAADVKQALDERRYRANSVEKQMQEHILEGSRFIATEGAVVGQVNGLTVLDTGDYAFGQPSRITARTFMGEGGVVHIERETEMSGPIHDKGLLTLRGYLGGKYAQNQPLTLTASLTFEQNYGGVDGDSASSTEIYALFSSLSGIPIKQGIAVTGSVNQLGKIQPIGGVNEKIEGFFDVCQARGLTGEQGVMIPASNMDNLMLREDVVTAVKSGQFHIWTIETIDEGIELLTGVPAGVADESGNYPEGTVHHTVQKRLLELAEEMKAFGSED